MVRFSGLAISCSVTMSGLVAKILRRSVIAWSGSTPALAL
jgi:hypothetical protein